VERGYDGTPVSVIASRVGVSKAAVTFYFPSKDLLAAEILGPVFDELERAVAESPVSGWPHGAWGLAGRIFDVLVDHHAAARWIESDQAIRGLGYGSCLDEVNEALIGAMAGRGQQPPKDRLRALAAVGGIWAPVGGSDVEYLKAHRDEILHAALVSYAWFELEDVV